MDSIDRIRLLVELEGLTRKELAEKTGTKTDRWRNVLNRQAKLYQEDIEALQEVFPEYAVWISTGMEFPDGGQISPLTKKAHAVSKTVPAAG